jgi:haloalkane dehalogenase
LSSGRAGVAHPERLTPQVRLGYLAPHPDWSSRTGILTFVREIEPRNDGPVSGFTAEIEAGIRRHFGDTPVAIAWGMADPAFTPRWLDDLWLTTFPAATVLRLPDANHYLQEDDHERIVPSLLQFVERISDRTADL